MSFATVVMKDVKETVAAIEKAGADVQKAVFTAARVEAYRLSNELKKDLNRGMVAGSPLAPLSEIAKLLRDRRKTAGVKPLKPLAKIVRYRVDQSEKNTKIHVGFVNPGGHAEALPGSWKRIVEGQQAGITFPVTEGIRRASVYWASQKGPRSKARKMGMLRKATTHFTTPARPVIAPFWRHHKPAALMNVKANTKKKLAGERI